ncbi:MAG TPA: hypothetical protein VJ998_05490, partial [Pseudomonadales bacterium]|nr:hypothetical protein [Pseudomonadales bacterium]
AHSTDLKFRYAALIFEIPTNAGSDVSLGLRAPNRFADFARLAATHQAAWSALPTSTAEQQVDLLYALDAFRQPDRFHSLNEFLAMALEGTNDTKEAWSRCFEVATKVSAASVDKNLKGSEIGAAIRAEQVSRIGSASG